VPRLPRQRKPAPAAALVCAALLCAAPALSAASEIRDLRGPFPAAGLPPFALSLLLLLVLGAACAGLAWSRASRRPTPTPSSASEATPDPVRSLPELSACFRSGALPAELLFLQIADLLRRELGCRAGVRAARLTSEELLERLAAGELLAPDDALLARRLFELCDRVKFAGHRPEPPQTEWLLCAAGGLLGRARGEAP
jgi:hypothetical protein